MSDIKSDLEIVSVEPRDIYVTFRIGIEGLKKLVRALEISEMDPKGDPEAVAAADYMTNEIYPVLKEITEEVTNHGP